MREPLVAGGRGRSPFFSALAVELLPGGFARVGGAAGSWTMVSDEALEVRGGGHEFLAFLGFEQLPADNGGDHLPLSLQRMHSRCGETVLGWYNKDSRELWGCWYGRRSAGSFLQQRAGAETLRGRRSRQAVHVAATPSVSGVGFPALSAVEVPSRPSPASADGGRRGLDWRNASGSRWVDEPMVQGRCGSCYASAALQMLSARHRIASGDPSLEGFSVAFPLYCGEYTEGCRGGYPFLAAKWSQDVGLVPASCAPYAPEGSCSVQCSAGQLNAGTRYRASGHRYVTGGEDAIIEELNRAGPVAVSFRSDKELQDYTGGVWEPPPLEGEEDDGFVAPTHSALLVGYGLDGSDGQEVPYWILQNTWGAEWGEHGAFRIRRDIARERGMESLVVAADVVPEDRPAIVDKFLQPAVPESASLLSIASSRAERVATRGHRGQPLCREAAAVPGDEAIVVRVDLETNFRGLSFGDSAGTETAVRCVGPTPAGCAVAAPGQPVPPCSEVEPCPCELHGQPLPYPGMQALADPIVEMCSSSSSPVRVLLVGLGGGAISSYLLDRCPPGRLALENVEKDARVASLASKFFGLATSDANTVEVADGLAAVSAADRGQFDAVLVDCFAGHDRVPLGCRSEEFYRASRALLRGEGLLLQNAWARSSASPDVAADFNATLGAFGAAFGRAPARQAVFDAPQSLEYVLYGLQGCRWSPLLPLDAAP
ncbi:unnamed protein product [Prorocentrum cordatum]|uniref:Dipeptidyl peptidase 1 n=1 Tax=Prorocentrum cordatum TaxID=2364126 RepID=A0ABN9WND8_9DINO|nr:unnamed protein product [Polarella glacialis]